MENEGIEIVEIETKIKYIVNLRWIRPLKGVIHHETKLAEFIPLITSNEINEIKTEKNNGILSVRCRVFFPEFKYLATSFGFNTEKEEKDEREHFKSKSSKSRISDSRYITEDREAYLKLMVYAVVRQSIRSEVKAHMLIETVKKLPYTELRYWANIFSKYYKEYGNIRALYRPARAFREVYDIDR